MQIHMPQHINNTVLTKLFSEFKGPITTNLYTSEAQRSILNKVESAVYNGYIFSGRTYL